MNNRRITRSTLAFLPAFLFACGGPDGGLSQGEDAIHTSSPVAGAWVKESGSFPFDLLVLTPFNSYTAITQVFCIQAPCPPFSEDGVYLVSQWDRRLVLISENSWGALYDYRRSEDGSILELRAAGEEEWSSLRAVEAETCGDSVCAPGFACCNALEGLCLPPDAVCHQ